ncbi:MAG: single-stranded DNA-binding protein, partial [Thermodesulfobacteriota bacterium]
DGNKRYTTEIVAREMKMLDSRSSQGGGGGGGGGGSYSEPPPAEPRMGDDVPF